MFDKGKRRMIRTTDIFQFVWVCGGIWWVLEDEQVNQDLEWEGVGCGERRDGELGNEKIRESSFLRVDKQCTSLRFDLSIYSRTCPPA